MICRNNNGWKERQAINFIKISNRKPDVVRFNKHNSSEHELCKCIVAWNLLSAGHSFITEAEFITGGRADVVDLTNGSIIEIISSEKEVDCIEKVKKYPDYFSVQISKVNDLIGNFKRGDL